MSFWITNFCRHFGSFKLTLADILKEMAGLNTCTTYFPAEPILICWARSCHNCDLLIISIGQCFLWLAVIYWIQILLYTILINIFPQCPITVSLAVQEQYSIGYLLSHLHACFYCFLFFNLLLRSAFFYCLKHLYDLFDVWTMV